MKLSRAGYSACAALLAFAVVVPAAAQAEAACEWHTDELPVPANTTVSLITGAADDGSWVIGLGHQTSPRQEDVTIVWRNGEAKIYWGEAGHFPKDIDTSGTHLRNSSNGTAWRGSMGLNPLPGSDFAWAASINSNGYVAGRSGRSIAIWEASPEPRAIPGTDVDGTWQVAGMDYQGRVTASLHGERGTPVQSFVWDENGARSTVQPLPGHAHTIVNSIRNGRIVGYSAPDGWADPVGVEWDVQGNVVRTLTGSYDARSVTSSGDVLGVTADGQGPGPAAIWRNSGEVVQPPNYLYDEIADNGDLYGRVYRDGSYTPVTVSCW